MTPGRSATRIVAGLLLALAPAAKAADSAKPWESYANARFGYTACYPATVFTPQGEADNGDGQQFLAPDGAELWVWGANNAQDESVDDMARRQVEGEVTYQAGKGNWRVVSGKIGTKVFYYKIIQRQDQFLSLLIRYDQAAAAVYTPMIKRLANCFGPT